jgi:two-component system sensor histidine kinase MprB
VPLRQRLSLVAATAVAVAIVLAVTVCYVVVRNQLFGQINSQLTEQAGLVSRLRSCSEPRPPASSGGGAPIWQVVDNDGQNVCGGGLPVDGRVEAVASGNGGPFFANVMINGTEFRQYTVPVTLGIGFQGVQPGALLLAQPLAPVNHILAKLRVVLALLCAAGIALAAALGRLAARRVLAPLAEVAQTAQHISETEDLTSRIRVRADDEVGQLATRFNAMIQRLQHSRSELDESVQAQRQLVADASHELRTPVTSLRTNIEVLLAGGELPGPERDRLLHDVVEQTEELSALVNDLIELARGDLPLSATEEVRLDRVVEDALARVRRNAPGVRFDATLTPVVLSGVAERLNRAVGNLLDNAARHSPPDGLVSVTVDADGVTVRDHGSGIADGDLPYIFDRFYRGVNSRGRQGSGLGLAIVRQVAEQHGGSVSARNARGGGALFTMKLPVLAADADAGGGDDCDGEEPARLKQAETPAPGPGGQR